ncbi:hypothetical protein FACS1894129_1390 [Actinomycetota bacterium]|nr:hypothetical protein FACS1894129_1390 [Actinomycetota bacterium]
MHIVQKGEGVRLQRDMGHQVSQHAREVVTENSHSFTTRGIHIARSRRAQDTYQRWGKHEDGVEFGFDGMENEERYRLF